MSGLWQRFLRLPQWGQYSLVVGGAVVVFALLSSGGDEDGGDTAATKTVTVTTPAPASTTATTEQPTETLADAQKAVENNQYATALAIGAALGEEDVVRRRIANQIARRVTAAVRAGNRLRASFLLQKAGKYPSTQAVAQARSSYQAAKQRAAARAQARKAAAAQAAAERQAREKAAATAPEPDSSGDGCDPGYSGCVPTYPPDVNCPDVDGPVQVTGSDPHGLDRDGDGVACE